MWDTRKSIQMAVFVGNMMINDGILGYSIRKPVGTPSWHRIIHGNPLCHSGNSCLATILLPPSNEHPQGRYQVFVQELMHDLSVLHQADVQLKVQVTVPQVLVTSLCVYNFTCALMTQPTPPYPTRPRPHFTRGVA